MAKAKRMVVKKKSNAKANQKKHETSRKKSNKIFLIGKIAIVATIIMAVYFLVETKVNEEVNHVKTIKEEKMFENLSIKDIDIKYENDNSYFKLKLVNESNTEFQEKDVKIVFQSPDGSEFTHIKYHINTIKPQEEFHINTSTNIKLIDASDFYIEGE